LLQHDPNAETVDILMAVYNGAETLPAQLKSFDAQTHPHWRLLASDDGSRDNSLQILQTFASRHPSGKVKIIQGPQTGASENFLGLLRHVADQGRAPRWIAFSDQDDVWLPDKISRAMNALRQNGPTHPALYCSRTWVTCSNLSNRRISVARQSG